MANQNRRLKRVIKREVKRVKSGELPLPPPPRQASPEEEAQFKEQMKRRVEQVHARLAKLADDSTRDGHKRRLDLSEELERIERFISGERPD